MVQIDLFQGLLESSEDATNSSIVEMQQIQRRKKVCESFLTYLYMGHAKLSSDIASDMMALSHQYGLQCLFSQCEVFICEMIDALFEEKGHQNELTPSTLHDNSSIASISKPQLVDE